MKNKTSPLQQWIKKQNADINLEDSNKRAIDIIKIIRSRNGSTPEQFRNEIKSRAHDYDIIDIVQAAALQGVTYSEEFGVEVAEGIIRSNSISMVSKVLDSIDEVTKKEQNNEQSL